MGNLLDRKGLKATYKQSIKWYINFILSIELIKVEFSLWDDLKGTFQVLVRQRILPDKGLALEK